MKLRYFQFRSQIIYNKCKQGAGVQGFDINIRRAGGVHRIVFQSPLCTLLSNKDHNVAAIIR